jgi:hypothetical protein
MQGGENSEEMSKEEKMGREVGESIPDQFPLSQDFLTKASVDLVRPTGQRRHLAAVEGMCTRKEPDAGPQQEWAPHPRQGGGQSILKLR